MTLNWQDMALIAAASAVAGIVAACVTVVALGRNAR